MCAGGTFHGAVGSAAITGMGDAGGLTNAIEPATIILRPVPMRAVVTRHDTVLGIVDNVLSGLPATPSPSNGTRTRSTLAHHCPCVPAEAQGTSCTNCCRPFELRHKEAVRCLDQAQGATRWQRNACRGAARCCGSRKHDVWQRVPIFCSRGTVRLPPPPALRSRVTLQCNCRRRNGNATSQEIDVLLKLVYMFPTRAARVVSAGRSRVRH